MHLQLCIYPCAYCIYINMYIVHIFDSGIPHSPQLLFNHLILFFKQQKWRRRAFLIWGRSNLRRMIQPAQTCRKASRPPSWRLQSPTYTLPRSQRPSRAGCGCNKGRASGGEFGQEIWDVMHKGERDAAWIRTSLNISFVYICIGFSQDLSQKEAMQKKGFILSCFVCRPLVLACSHLFDRYIHNAQILVQTLLMWQHSIFGQYSKKPANVHTGEKYRKQNMLYWRPLWHSC